MTFKNLRYNRMESNTGHKYLHDFNGLRSFEKNLFEGFIKCKLFHGNGFSLIIPDQVYVETSQLWWIQPLFFAPNLISKTDDYIECNIWVDISFGACIQITFRNNEFIRRLSDGSEIYKCKILGPERLEEYAIGRARWKGEGNPQIHLFHHTKEETIGKIIASGHFLPSSWNIQGNKKLVNIKYVYFTCLESIKYDEDLSQIAMANHGKLGFCLDQNFSGYPDLVIDVYRENTLNRRHTISLWVESSLLAPQPVYKHSPPGNSVYYEIVQPLTHRIGLEPGTTLKISGDQVETANVKQLGFAVLGDATSIEGLEAPFHEAETCQVVKIEIQDGCTTNLDFWMEHSNKDHFSNKAIEVNKFEDDTKNT